MVQGPCLGAPPSQLNLHGISRLPPLHFVSCDTGTRWSMYGCPRWCRRARASAIAFDAVQYQRPCWSRALRHQLGYPADQAYGTCHGLSVKAVTHMNILLKSHDYRVLRYHVCLGMTWYGKTLHVPLICKRRKSMKQVYNSQVNSWDLFWLQGWPMQYAKMRVAYLLPGTAWISK